ncbi:MAG: dephospho-CoA kinase [Lachnospiraceae bacterium]|nr:dephospho-CoA kinase [Lachnospiraceae bacterium]
MKSYIIGITGGVGSGKSLALEYLSEVYDCIIIKADDIGNEVKLKGRECYNEIIDLLGKDILNEYDEIDKKKMSDIIFADPALVEKINAIIHPAVRKEIENIIEDDKGDHAFIVIEAALLVEADYFDILNELWVVDSSKEIRIKRLMETRGYSLEKCENIMAFQNDTDYYIRSSDLFSEKNPFAEYYGIRVLQNNEGKNELYSKIDNAMEEINGRIE